MERDNAHCACPYEGLGLLYLRQDRIEDARQHFEKAIEIDPTFEYRKFTGLAKIYIREGDYERAETLLKRALKNYPHIDEAAILLESIPVTKTE